MLIKPSTDQKVERAPLAKHSRYLAGLLEQKPALR